MVSVEEFFLRYAFPCAHVILQSGKMSEKRYNLLESAAKGGEVPSRELIEESFPAAFRRLRKLASSMGREVWDEEVMVEYWHRNHNVVIDAREGNYANFPESFCDFCKVHIAEVKEVFDEALLVEYEGRQRVVMKDYVSEAKVGDKVRIHHAYATEMV